MSTVSFSKFALAFSKWKLLWLSVATVGLIGLGLIGLQNSALLVDHFVRIVPLSSLSGALLTFALRLTDVPIGTVKTVMMVRGMRGWATALGLIEVSLWVMAIGRVMGQLDNAWNIFGYAGGYAVGTWLGMWIENRLAFGSVEVHTISLTKSAEVAAALRAAGYGVTQLQGYGQSGPVCIVGTIAERKHLDSLIKRIRFVDSQAFITVDETRQVVGGYRPAK